MKELVFALLTTVLLAGTVHALDLGDMGVPVARTPYDASFAGVRKVLARSSRRSSLSEVQGLLREARVFRYAKMAPFAPQPPALTEQTQAGDCKAKSLWMASRMRDPRVRVVVGKLRAGKKESHMWLMWRAGRVWWVLDPTVQWEPTLASTVGAKDWIALYSYTRSGALIHAAATRTAATRSSAVSIASRMPVHPKRGPLR